MTRESTGSSTMAGSWGGVCCCWPTTPQCLWPSWDALWAGWWMQWGGPACLHATRCQCLTPSTDICTGGRGKVSPVVVVVVPERSRALTCSRSDFMFIITVLSRHEAKIRQQKLNLKEWTFGELMKCKWGLTEVRTNIAFYFFKLLKHSFLLHSLISVIFLCVVT